MLGLLAMQSITIRYEDSRKVFRVSSLIGFSFDAPRDTRPETHLFPHLLHCHVLNHKHAPLPACGSELALGQRIHTLPLYQLVVLLDPTVAEGGRGQVQVHFWNESNLLRPKEKNS